jgi:hypothetical protein
MSEAETTRVSPSTIVLQRKSPEVADFVAEIGIPTAGDGWWSF